MNSPVSEYRRDLELPYVEDTDASRLVRLTELMEAFANGHLPGVGIVHIPEDGEDINAVAVTHRQLVASATETLQPGIKVVMPLPEETERVVWEIRTNIDAHLDGLPRDGATAHSQGLGAAWLLHTGLGQTAQVTLASSRPGAYCYGEIPHLGDLTLDYEEKEDRGYDEDENGLLIRDRRQHKEEPDWSLLVDGSYDPLTSEPEVYHFEQTSLSSVLFVLGSALGPRTIHNFSAEGPRGSRRVATARMEVMAH